jgi:hypothetical protein
MVVRENGSTCDSSESLTILSHNHWHVWGKILDKPLKVLGYHRIGAILAYVQQLLESDGIYIVKGRRRS